MNRPHTSSQTQRTKPTLRVLGRLPYVASSPEDSTPVSDPAPATDEGLFVLTDPIKRGLVLGVAVVAILSITWYFVSRKSGNSELADKHSDQAWEVQTPRPDAPEAPVWNPNGDAGQSPIQSAQAQAAPGFDGLFSDSTSVTRSPLGFELPPGNGWGQPSLQEDAPIYPNNATIAAASANSWQQPAAGQALPSYQAQTGLEPAAGVGTTSPLASQSALQFATSAPPPPWVNAASQPSGTQPAGFVTETYSAVPARAPVQSAIPGSPAVVRNPYVGEASSQVSDPLANPANAPPYPAMPVTAFSNSGQFSPGGTGQRGYESSPASGWPTTANQQPAQPAQAYAQPAEAYLASRSANQWGTAAPTSGWQPNVAYPNAPQGQGATWDQANRLGNAPLAPIGGNQTVAANNGFASPTYPQATYPQGNWNIPGGQQPTGWGDSAVAPSAVPAWNVPPGQPPQAPSYPSTPSPLSPMERSNTAPSVGGDSQVVPATYARPTPTSVSASQGWSPRGVYPSAGTTASGVSAAPSQYPSTGQTGYGLYPATTVR